MGSLPRSPRPVGPRPDVDPEAGRGRRTPCGALECLRSCCLSGVMSAFSPMGHGLGDSVGVVACRVVDPGGGRGCRWPSDCRNSTNSPRAVESRAAWGTRPRPRRAGRGRAGMTSGRSPTGGSMRCRLEGRHWPDEQHGARHPAPQRSLVACRVAVGSDRIQAPTLGHPRAAPPARPTVRPVVGHGVVRIAAEIAAP